MKKHQATINENELIEKHQGLIRIIARRFNPPNETEMEEYIQEGNIALLKASRKFNIKKGHQLSTLAWTYIVRAISQYIYIKKKKDWIEPLGSKDIGYFPSEKLWESLPDGLSTTESEILSMRLNGSTFKEIGEKFGYTKAWASKTLNKLMQKIKTINE
jgi:RNA polymerase sigma factor (sigma-70 family)